MGEPRVLPRWTMPTFTGARLPASPGQQAQDRAGDEKLRLGGDTDAVSAAAAMEELLAARPDPPPEVLEIGRRRGCAAEHGGVEGPAPGGEQPERDKAAADLEAPVVNVLVRNTVTGHVQRRAEQKRKHPGADERAGCAARRHVERDDHRPDDRLCSPAMSFLARLRKMLAGPPHIQGGDVEGDAALHEDFGSPDEGAADVRRMETTAGGAVLPGYASSEAAEAGEEDLASEEAPPDPAP